MPDRKVTIGIETTADTKGIVESDKGLEKLSKTANETAKTTKGATDGTKQFGQATGRAAEMVGSLTGAMGANSPAAAQMGAGLRVIKSLAEGSAGGIMGLTTVIVGIGVSAWTAYQRKVEEAKKKLDEFVSQMTDRKIETGARRIEAIAEGFGRVEKAISSARAAQSELAAAWDDLNRAGQEVTSMELERREKADLARVNPEDQAGAAAVRARYTGLRESAALGARAGGAIRAEQAAQDDLTAASGRRANIEQTLGSSISARDIVAAQLARSSSRADPSNPDEEDRKNAAKETAAFTAQLAQLEKQVGELTDALAAARTTERAAGIRVQAAGIRAAQGIGAAEALAQQNTSDADLSATRTAWAQRLSDLRGRASSAASALSTRAVQFRAASDAYTPQRSDYDDQGDWNKARGKDRSMESQAKGAERLSDSARKLSDQLAKMNPEQLSSLFDTITRQLAQLDQAIKNAGQRSKNQ